jgi:hypothetical protein
MSDLKFYEYSSGTVVCEECLNEDIRKTRLGEFTGDEAVSNGMYEEIETPAQCDNCLTQSEDYDYMLVDDDEE